MKATIKATLIATVFVCSIPLSAQPPAAPKTPIPAASAPSPQRSQEVIELEKRLQTLTNAFGNLQLSMVEIYCEQCPIALKKQNRNLAPYLHIAGRFFIIREGLFQLRDSLHKETILNARLKEKAIEQLGLFEVRLKLSEASIVALEPGSDNPLYQAVVEKLRAAWALFDSKGDTHVTDALDEDLSLMRESAQYLARSSKTGTAIQKHAQWIIGRLEDIDQNHLTDNPENLYVLLDAIHDRLYPNYLLIDQFGMEYSLYTTEEEESLRTSAVNLLGASELFAEYSRFWAKTEFEKRRHVRLSTATAEAKGGEDREKTKVLAVIFYDDSNSFRPSAAVLKELKNVAIAYLPASYTLTSKNESQERLLDHPAFAVLNKKPGVVFVNYQEPQSTTYRRVVAHFSKDEWNRTSAWHRAVQNANEASRQ